MTRLILTLTLVMGLVTGVATGLSPAMAQSERAADPAVEAVIAGQIDAFKDDDFDAAFAYASPNIRSIFGSVDRFAAMVRQGYPMVHRPKDVQFLGLRDENGQVWQKVLVRDAAGVIHLLDYQMVETPEGWQIDGVQLLRAEQLGA